jgi:hypothetical protein
MLVKIKGKALVAGSLRVLKIKNPELAHLPPSIVRIEDCYVQEDGTIMYKVVFKCDGKKHHWDASIDELLEVK